MAPQTASQVAPGSSIGASPLSGDMAPGTHNLGPVIRLTLGSREECIGTLERIGRAVLAGRLAPTKARVLIEMCRASLQGFAIAGRRKNDRQKRHNADSTGKREADRRVAENPEGDPDEPETEPIVAADRPEPTFEELLDRSTRGRAGRPGGP